MEEKVRFEVYAGDHIGGFDATFSYTDGVLTNILVNGHALSQDDSKAIISAIYSNQEDSD